MIGRKGAAQDLLHSPLTGMLIVVIFLVLMSAYLYQQSYGAATWEDAYAKELAIVLNDAKPGDTFTLDVHRATVIAEKNHVSFNDIFSFSEQQVCVKLSRGRKTCQQFFNAVKISEVKMRLGVPKNVLEFRVVGKEEKA